MPAYLCTRCQQMLEIAKPPAGVIPCPQCGTALQPAEEQQAQGGGEGVLQSALDEIIERPGVRMFCTVMSSVVVHVGMLCLLFLVFWGAAQVVAEEEKASEISAALIADDTPSDASGFKFEGKANTRDTEDAPIVDKTKPVIDKPVGAGDLDEVAPALNKSITDSKASGYNNNNNVAGWGGAASGANALGIIGRGGSAGSAGSGRGGGGNGSGFGNGNRPGGGEVFGVGGLPGAKSIIYVVDRSGSMDTLSDFLKHELAKAVNRLNSTQKFNVIWFSDGEPHMLAVNLVQATEDNKTRLFKHLQDVKMSGSTDPRQAIFKALQMRPELIYVLTDGNFEPEFVQAVTKANTAKIRINAIGFVLPGGEGHTNLERLVKENNGKFKAIDAIKLTGGN